MTSRQVIVRSVRAVAVGEGAASLRPERRGLTHATRGMCGRSEARSQAQPAGGFSESLRPRLTRLRGSRRRQSPRLRKMAATIGCR